MMWQAAQGAAQLAPVLKEGSPCSCWWWAGAEAGGCPQLLGSGETNLQDSWLGEMREREAKRCRSLLLGLKASEEAGELFWGKALPGRPQRR